MPLCEICHKREAVFEIQITKLLRTTSGEVSKHVPRGQTFRFGICQPCLPFERQEIVEEKVTTTRKVKGRTFPL